MCVGEPAAHVQIASTITCTPLLQSECPASEPLKFYWLGILLKLNFWDAPRECNLDSIDAGPVLP